MGIGASGYIGVVRLEKGLFDVAAAIRPEAVRSSGGGSQALCRLMEQAGMSGGLEPVGCHGTPRLTRTRLAVEGERLIVAGDASAYVEPFTGEGMSWALWSGRRAALWAEGIVRGVKPVWRWADELDRGLRKRRLACRLVAHVLRERDRCEGIIEVAATVPRLSAWISGRFGRPWPQPVDGARR
jgi:flavin-dependent dehydrogenase